LKRNATRVVQAVLKAYSESDFPPSFEVDGAALAFNCILGTWRPLRCVKALGPIEVCVVNSSYGSESLVPTDFGSIMSVSREFVHGLFDGYYMFPMTNSTDDYFDGHSAGMTLRAILDPEIEAES